MRTRDDVRLPAASDAVAATVTTTARCFAKARDALRLSRSRTVVETPGGRFPRERATTSGFLESLSRRAVRASIVAETSK
jgi:hypothetical protein